MKSFTEILFVPVTQPNQKTFDLLGGFLLLCCLLLTGNMLSAQRAIIAEGSPAVYQLENGERRHIPDEPTLGYMGYGWSDVQKIQPTKMDRIPEGRPFLSRKEDKLYKGSGNAVYIMKGGKRCWAKTAAVFGGQWHKVQVVADKDLMEIPEGPSLPQDPIALTENSAIIAGNNPAVYVYKNGERRHIPDEVTLGYMGYTWGSVVRISEEQMNSITIGTPFLSRKEGKLYKGSGNAVYIIKGGKRCWAKTAAVFGGQWHKVQVVSDEALNEIPEGESIG